MPRPRRGFRPAVPAAVPGLVIGLVLALALTGCSSSSDDPETPDPTDAVTRVPEGASEAPELDPEQRVYADAMADQLDLLPDSPVKGEAATCLSSHVVDLLGRDVVAKAGGVEAFVASADAFDFGHLGASRAQGEAIYDAFSACGADLAARFREQLTKVAEGNSAYGACIDAAWSPEAFRDLFVGDMTHGGAESYAQAAPESSGAGLTRAVVECAAPA